MSNRPVEEEFRSSQTYRMLKNTGIPAADRVAESLGRAAGTVDSALNTAGGAVARGAAAVQSAAGSVQHAANTVAGSVRYAQSGSGEYHYGRGNVPGNGSTVGGAPYGQGRSSATPTQNPGSRVSYGYSQRPAQQQAPQRQVQQPPVQPAPQAGPPMKLVRKGSRAKYYLTGAAALLFSSVFPLYEPVHYLIFGVFLAGVYMLSGKLFKGKKEWVPDLPQQAKTEDKKAQEQPKAEEKPSATGDPEVDKLIDEGKKAIKKLRAANDAIPDEALSEDIDRMERASADIFRFIAEHPEKAPQIRKFMNYYLPTTLKLLNTYQRLARQSARGENITSTMFNIAGMMHTVADAFEKQLDSLFTDEAMDVSADISVFETLLAQEGLAGETKVERAVRRGGDQTEK